MSDSHSKSSHVAKFVGRTVGSGPTPAQTLMRHGGGKRHFKTGGLIPVVGQAQDTPAHPGKGYSQGGLTPPARVPVNTEQQMLRKGGRRCRAAGGQMGREDHLKADDRRSGASEMTKEDRLARAMGGAAKTRKGFPNT